MSDRAQSRTASSNVRARCFSSKDPDIFFCHLSFVRALDYRFFFLFYAVPHSRFLRFLFFFLYFFFSESRFGVVSCCFFPPLRGHYCFLFVTVEYFFVSRNFLCGFPVFFLSSVSKQPSSAGTQKRARMRGRDTVVT